MYRIQHFILIEQGLLAFSIVAQQYSKERCEARQNLIEIRKAWRNRVKLIRGRRSREVVRI